MIEKDDLYFKTNVQLKSIIGKDLINDDNIAILELVKNAFDADSKKVEIEFLNLKENDDLTISLDNAFTKKTSRILIKDDGVGMGLIDIRDKWLNIAYSEKKNNSRQHNRLMAGAKGVGRFSCDRLGEYLHLYSKKADADSYIQLIVDWKAFEIEDDKNKEIQSIPIKFNELTNADLVALGIAPFETGVLLEIIKLRSNWVYSKSENNTLVWNLEKLIDLKKYLEKLINPNQAFVENDFGIYIAAPEFIEENAALNNNDKFIGKVDNRIFEKLDFRSTSIESEIIEDGKVIYTELKDRGRTIFWIKEKNKFEPFIKNSKVVLYYLSTYAKAFFTKQTGIRSLDYGSVFLFVNGFRVPPYGELGNDWLLFDQRKAQGYARFLGSRDIVGRIEILDKSKNFQIVSSREGIVRNDSYKMLVDQRDGYVYKTFRRLERFVVDGLNWDSMPADKNISEIEKKIISGETKEDELTYREDELTKSRRVYSSIHSIISADPNEVIELYINEELITAKIAEERAQSEREFQQLIDDFENKKIDGAILEKILLRKAAENKDLERQIKEFSKYTTSDATNLAILDIQNYRKTIDDQQRLIAGLKAQLDNAEKERATAESKAQKAQTEAEKVKEELTETKSQNLFLKSIKSQDLNEVLNLMHHIGISTSTIQHYIKGVTFRLDNNLALSNTDLKKIFSEINYEINKIYSISKFATKANFKVTTQDTKLDVVSFVEQYLINIVKPFLPPNFELKLYKNSIEDFEINFKPIELTIVLDNLINNSRKAGATKIEVTFEPIDENNIQMHFKDNGSGVPHELWEKIFDYGFTTTEGSGLGLTHVSEIIERIGGKIELNKNVETGTEFTLNFKKQ